MASLKDLLFPYRMKKDFGAASFALIFLVLIGEVEVLALVALGIIAHRFDLFVDLQIVILPVACLIALAAAVAFWWRARSWTKSRVELLNVWAGGGATGGGTALGEKLASKRQPK